MSLNFDSLKLLQTIKPQLIMAQAKAEGVNCLKEDVALIIEGKYEEISTPYTIYELTLITNLVKGWEFLEATINEELTVDWVKQMHGLLSKGVIYGKSSSVYINMEGQFRTTNVKIGGSSYSPKLLTYVESYAQLNKLLTKKGQVIYLEMCKAQFFADVNKRTSLLTANKALICANEGVLVLPDSDEGKEEFYSLLLNYYESKYTLEDAVVGLNKYVRKG